MSTSANGGGLGRGRAWRCVPPTIAIAVALALRLWSIDGGAPYLYHPDEHFILHPALNIVRETDLNPRFFGYPSLLIYLQAGLVAAGRLFVHASLATDLAVTHLGPWDALPEQWPFALAGRLLVATFAVVGVWLVYRVGTLYAGRASGVAAALFLAVSPLHNESSHYLTTDVPAATVLTAALLFSVMGAEARGRRLLAAAGFCAGLAAATKYTAGIIVFVPLGVALSRSFKQTARCWAVIVAAAAMGFCVACPYAVLDFPAFWKDLVGQRQHYLAGYAPGGNWGWYLSSLSDGLGRPVALLAAAGLLAALLPVRERANASRGGLAQWRLSVVLAVVAAAYFAVVASYPYRAERNLILLLPTLCVFAGAFGWRIVSTLAGSAALPLYCVGAGLLAIPGGLASVRHDVELRRPDTRTAALQWIDANVDAGARMVREAYTPQVPDERVRVTYAFSAATHDYAWYLSERIDYLVLSSNVYGRALVPPYIAGSAGPAFYELVFERLPLLTEIAPDAEHAGPTIRIYEIPHE